MSHAPLAVAETDQAERPVFLFGYPRSGTTLLSVIFAAHPSLAIPFSTTGLWFRVQQTADAGSAAALRRTATEVFDDERIRLWGADLDKDDVLARVGGDGFGDVVRAFHAAYADWAGKPQWGNIDISTLDHMHEVNRWFPEARFVHIVRDPRDVVLSNESIPYRVGNALDIARAWDARVRTNLRMGAMLPPERYAVMRYEDLLADPERTLQSVCRQIDLPYAPAMLDYAAQARQQVPEAKRWLWPKLEGPLAKQNIDRWRSEMGRHQRALVEQQTGALMRELGYEPEPASASKLGLYGLEAWYNLTAGNRLRRVARRLGLRRGAVRS